MKKYIILLVIPLFFSACTNPMLKWIETPEELSSGDGGTSQGGGGGGGGTSPASTAPNSEKEITAFSFGFSPDDSLVDIRLDETTAGYTPIKAIVPAGTDVKHLIPTIAIKGKTVGPPSGQVMDFSNPVVYTVTAEDGSTRKYVVEVSVKSPQSAEIVWFDLEIPGKPNNPAEGVVNQPSGSVPGEIIVHVPSGTSLTNLTAKIAQTGALTGPGVSNGEKVAATSSTNFSGPVTYTVTSGDGNTTTDYVVTVIKDKSDVKEITAFSFNGYEDMGHVMIGAAPQADGKIPIVVTVPLTATPSSLTPKITYKGAALGGPGISVTRAITPTTNFAEPVPVTGSPAQNFSVPVTYTVTSEDGYTKDYEVTVFQGDLNSGKEITGFYFILPTTTAAGTINETTHTINVTVPSGTNLTSLTPTIYHTGVSISPDSGAPRNFSGTVSYTVTAADNTTQAYQVSVRVAKSSDKAITAFDFTNAGGETTVIGSTPGPDGRIPIVVTVPSNITDITTLIPRITHEGTSVTGPGIPSGGSGTVTGSTSVGSTGPFTYTVTAEDGSKQDYSVSVVKTPDPTTAAPIDVASIDGFYFNNPQAVGTITQPTGTGTGTIAVTVPYGTVLNNLIPTIYFTGAKIENAADASTAQITHPASIAADFTVPVQYTVTPLNQSASDSKTYTVTVTVGPAPPASNVRAITFVSFAQVDDVDLTCVISPTPVPYGSTTYPVEVIVPAGTTINSLTPVILFKGASISGAGSLSSPTPDPANPEIKSVTAGSTVNFTTPQTYTVTAENNQTSDYVVTVRAEDNNAKEITGFYFTSPAAAGVIDEPGKIITVTVPYGTALNGLVPTVSYKGVSLAPASGTAVDFRSPVTYTVTARNGTVQPYTVRVIPKPATTKEITAISFPGAGVLETVIGAVPDSSGYTPISVTVSSQTDIGALHPVITHTGASITPPGGTAQSAKPYTDSVRNFGSTQVYTVTAEDGGTKNYAVSVHISGGGAKIITGFVFKSIPGVSGTVVGQIDQDTHTIEVRVPHSATINSLAPTITYLGKSAAYTGTSTGGTPQNQNNALSGQTGATYTDAARDFSTSVGTPLYYMVTAVDNSTQPYTVKVVKIPEVTVTYSGIKDDKFITEKFEQKTGVLTVTIDTTNPFPTQTYYYTTSFEWYVDGVKQPVSSTQASLTLKTTDFQAGQHEVVAAAKRSADSKYYTNKMYFLVKE